MLILTIKKETANNFKRWYYVGKYQTTGEDIVSYKHVDDKNKLITVFYSYNFYSDNYD